MSTLLIIEDEESLRQTLADRLAMEGFSVQTAAAGHEGVNMAQTQPPDLILCDIMMPGMDGYAVLKSLRADDRTAAIPFIFLTAKADPPQVRAGMELGADDYLCKPVAKADLLSAVRARLAKSREQHQRNERATESALQQVLGKLPKELLTPLTILLDLGKRMESTVYGKSVAETREFGRVIFLNSQRLQSKIQRFMLEAELSKTDHPEQTQAPKVPYFSIASLTAELAKHLALEDSRLDDLQLDLREMEVAMDPAHYASLITELVENAFKFSVPGSVVRVLLRFQPDQGCVLEVRDQGRGMSADQLSQVNAAQSSEKSPSQQYKPTPGLALVTELVGLYRASFELESDPGNGTRAILRIPNARTGP